MITRSQRFFRIVKFLFSQFCKFGIDHINNIEVKELRVVIFYYLFSVELKGSLIKLELVEAVTDFFRKDLEGVAQRWGGSVVTNESGREPGD